MTENDLETWEFWYPGAGATGLLVARARIDPTPAVWLHAAPPVLSVRVRRDSEESIARGRDLKREGPRLPMTRLFLTGTEVRREDRWPTEDDIGATVILPGGEAGVLQSWWNREDQKEWRWTVEFYNHA